MENATKNIELIDKFIENQRRSKLWTIISVAIFVVMAVFILFYSKKLAETKGKLTVSEQKLKEANELLEAKNKTLDSVNALLAQMNDSVITENTGLALSLGQNKVLTDSLSNLKDTITVLLNKSLQQIPDQGQEPSDKIIELYLKAFPGKSRESLHNILKQVENTKVINDPRLKPALVAVRFTPEYVAAADEIYQSYSNRIYTIDKPVEVKGGNFYPVVKYFSDEDKGRAEKLAKRLNEQFGDKFGKQFEIQRVDLKNTSQYLEIWLGRYIIREYKTIEQQLIRKNFNKIQ